MVPASWYSLSSNRLFLSVGCSSNLLLSIEASKGDRILLPQLDNTRFIMSILLADFHLASSHLLGLHTLMKSCEEATVARNSSQPSANSQLETEDHHATALKKMNSSIVILDMDPSTIKPSDETPALAETVTL